MVDENKYAILSAFCMRHCICVNIVRMIKLNAKQPTISGNELKYDTSFAEKNNDISADVLDTLYYQNIDKL